MFLVDSNVWLERLLDQERAGEVGEFLDGVEAAQLLIFDDAYQYVAAAKAGATIVSFDRDLDRTDRGRKTPAEALAEVRGHPGGQE